VGRQEELPSLPRSEFSAPTCACECSRVTTKLFQFCPDIIPSVVWTHKSCVCNVKVALNHRHQLDTGARFTSKDNLWKSLKKWVKRIDPVSNEAIIRHASSRKKKLLIQADESLKSKPVCVKDAAVRMFLKDDKYHTLKIGAPRCIQYRSKRYCLPLATYLHPIEEYVYTWKDLSGTSIFAKARNLRERGEDIRTKFDFFMRPAVVSLDHSKFDCHVNKQLLELEHRFYQACNDSRELKDLLKWQKCNRGKTSNGVKYKTMFTRMSGDQNTGLGNSLINYAMTVTILEKLKIKYCLYIDGDDFLVFVERRDVNLINPKHYQEYGMSTKLDNVAYEMEHIDFCQTRPVSHGESYTMVRSPIRMLERIQWGVGKFNKTYIRNYLTSIGQCCLSLGMGLPVEQYVGYQLAQLGGKRKVITNLHYSANKMPFRVGKARVVEPTLATRLSYERAWGLSISLQQTLESLKIDLETQVDPVMFPQYGTISDLSTEGYKVPFWSLRA